MLIRRFKQEDFEPIEAILASYNMQPDIPNALISRPELKPTYYVAEDEGEIVGGGGMFVIDGEHPVGWLATVAVKKGRKRSGVGRAIVNANLKLAAERGYGSMWLETYFWNSKFYESLGFEGIKPVLLPEEIARWRSKKHCRVMVNTGCFISTTSS